VEGVGGDCEGREGGPEMRTRSRWCLPVIVVIVLANCVCTGSDFSAVPCASGSGTELFLRSMLVPGGLEMGRLRLAERDRQRCLFAEVQTVKGEVSSGDEILSPVLRSGSREDGVTEYRPAADCAGLQPGVHFLLPQASTNDTVPRVSTGECEESPGHTAPRASPAEREESPGPLNTQARSCEPFEVEERGYDAVEDGAWPVEMAGLQCIAELRRLATSSEQQLAPLNFSTVAAHPATAPFRWFADRTLLPFSEMLGRTLEEAYETLSTQPEVLVWQLKPGDHLRVKGVAGFVSLTHHALYLGDGRIMHFTGGVTEKANATIKVDTLHKLSKYMTQVGHKACRIEVVPHPSNALERREIVERALSLVGQTGYNLFSKNCEHVVLWCVTGEEHSYQVGALST
jgi:hypothetical protein